MCFSAVASFTSAAMLGSAGIYTLRLSNEKNIIPVAAIPLVFGIQQFCEGWVWLSLTNENYRHIHANAVKAFLFFAMFFWPLYISFSYAFAEPNNKRKKWMNGIFIIGTMEAAMLGYYLLYYKPSAEISGMHLHYNTGLDDWSFFLSILYGISTMLPPFLSSLRYSYISGFMLVLSFIVTKLFYNENVISVWCYFAALTSITVFFVIREQEKTVK